MLKRLLIIGLILGLALGVAGISGWAAPKKGGDIIVGLGEEPETLDPMKTTRFHSYLVLHHIVEPLFTLDKNFHVIPLLADSYDWAKDGLTMTVNLKQGIKFHNGAEMTADDVKASYERYLSTSPLASYLPAKKDGIYEIDTPDKYTVVFKFKSPKPLALYHMADAHAGILPAAWLADTPDEDIGIRALVGTGPLKFVEWVPGDRIVMARNEDYHHGPAFIENQGTTYADRMIFRIIPEDATLVAELRSGNVDISFDIPPRSVKLLQDASNVQVKLAPTFSVQYMAMNVKSPFFGDKKVREAVAHAINKEAISKAAWFGVGQPIKGLIDPATIGYWPGVKDYEYKYDVAKAKALLEEAGWVDSDGDGIREKDGKEFEVTLITFSDIDQWKRAGEISQALLKNIGIKVNLDTAEVGATYDRGNAGDYDLGIFRNTWWLGQPYLRFLVHPNSIGIGNYGRWENDRLGELVDLAGSSLSLSERTESLNEVQKMVVDSAIWVPLVANANIVAAKANIGGLDELISHPWWPPLMRALSVYKK